MFHPNLHQVSTDYHWVLRKYQAERRNPSFLLPALRKLKCMHQKWYYTRLIESNLGWLSTDYRAHRTPQAILTNTWVGPHWNCFKLLLDFIQQLLELGTTEVHKTWVRLGLPQPPEKPTTYMRFPNTTPTALVQTYNRTEKWACLV